MSEPGQASMAEMAPLALLARIDELCDRFEDDWLSGRRPRIEDYLEPIPPQGRPALLAELLRLELHYRRSRGEAVAQRLPLAEGHGDEQRAVGGLVDLVDGADVGVIEGGGGARLAQEAPLVLLAGAALGGEELERHRPVELEVDRLVDHAHAAAPEAIEDPVVGDRAADQRKPSWPGEAK